MSRTLYRPEQVSKEASEWVDIVASGRKADGILAWASRSREHVSKYFLLSVLPSLARDSERIQNIDSDRLYAEARAYAAAENKKHSQKVWALAASVAAVTLVSGFLFYKSMQAPWTSYDTVGGRPQVVKLAEGSTIDMRTGTRLRVRVSEDSRDVQLTTGGAEFEVVHLDDGRPFRVTTRDATIEVVGTRFRVDSSPDRSFVDVQAGLVKVTSVEPSEAPRMLKAGKSLTLLPGGRIADVSDTQGASDAGAGTTADADASLYGKTLGEIALTLNHDKQWFIVDGDIQDKKILAAVKASDTKALIAILERRQDLVVEQKGDQVLVKSRR